VEVPAICRAIRHAPVLNRADWLWRRLRPSYEDGLRIAYRRRGMPLAVGGGERIRVDPACREFVWSGELGEEHLWSELMAEIRAGDRFADVGANIGVYTVGAARRGAMVVSYEPNPRVAALLRRNIGLNGVEDRVTVSEAAVGAVHGELLLSPIGVLDVAARIDPAGSVRVRSVTLDGPFDVVKIDVEGYELEVLEGARALLADPARRPRAVFLELHSAVLTAAGVDPQSFRALVPGYTATRLGGREHTEHWVLRD
jgi:FkbM family methyltransferase